MKKCAIIIGLCCCCLASCTKEGDTIYEPLPGEEQPASTPLVTVIYGPNGLGDRSYNDLIYKGVETAAKKYGLRTLQLSPETEEQGLAMPRPIPPAPTATSTSTVPSIRLARTCVYIIM